MEDGAIQFKTLTEFIKSDGSTGWANNFTLSPCILEDIDLRTTAAYEKVEVTSKPSIIPMGIKACTCKVMGKFENNMILDCVNNSHVGVEVSNEDILNTTTSDPENTQRLAITVVDGLEDFPELTGIWTIKAFQWDRAAKELGSYRFSMELSYFWDDPSESKLYDPDTSYEPQEKVRFECTINGDSTRYKIYNTKIHECLNDYNRTTFSTVDDILKKKDVIKIYKENSNEVIFNGYVKNAPNKKDGTFGIECNEMAWCLSEMPTIKQQTGGLFKSRIIIHNPVPERGQLTIGEFVKIIMSFFVQHPDYTTYNPGKGICRATSGSGNNLAESQYIPGRAPGDTEGDTGTYLPSNIISGKPIGKALDDFLENTCGFKTWFKRETGALEYGFIRDKITIDPSKEAIMSTEKMDDENALPYKPNIVVVWSSDGQTKAYWPHDEFEDGKITIMNFRLSSNNFAGSLEAFAERIYNDTQVNTDIFKVRFPPGTTRFKEGDWFSGLGDQTIAHPMEYKTGEDLNPLVNPDTIVLM